MLYLYTEKSGIARPTATMQMTEIAPIGAMASRHSDNDVTMMSNRH